MSRTMKIDVPVPKDIEQILDIRIKNDLKKARSLLRRRDEQIVDWRTKCAALESDLREAERKLKFYDRLREYFKEMVQEEG